MTSFELFVREGNERADELATDGAMSDGCEVAQMGASTHAALQYAACIHCLTEDLDDCVGAKRRMNLREQQRNIARSGVQSLALLLAKKTHEMRRLMRKILHPHAEKPRRTWKGTM